MAQQPNPHNAQLANLEPGEAATTAVTILTKATISTAKAHPKITGSWMLGLALVVFATGFRVSDGAASKYEQDVQAADLSEPISRAAARVRRARSLQRSASGWFSCDDRCQYHKSEAETASRELADLRAREDAGLSDAKKGVGVLSEYAVAEARDSFWRAFAGGKSFAKRQSMWDLLFSGLRFSGRRDESTAAVVIRWLIQLLFNFTLGLCGALGVFLWRLRALVASYQPGPLHALAFTLAAALAATAMVATYLFAMYFCAASGVAAVGAAASAQARIEAERRRDPRYRVQQQQQPYGQPGYGQPRYRPRTY